MAQPSLPHAPPLLSPPPALAAALAASLLLPPPPLYLHCRCRHVQQVPDRSPGLRQRRCRRGSTPRGAGLRAIVYTTSSRGARCALAPLHAPLTHAPAILPVLHALTATCPLYSATGCRQRRQPHRRLLAATTAATIATIATTACTPSPCCRRCCHHRRRHRRRHRRHRRGCRRNCRHRDSRRHHRCHPRRQCRRQQSKLQQPFTSSFVQFIYDMDREPEPASICFIVVLTEAST